MAQRLGLQVVELGATAITVEGHEDDLRELIRARTGEGRKGAMAKGANFGRPRKLNPH